MRFSNIVLSASLLLAFCVLSAVPALAVADPFEPQHIALGPDGNVYALIAGNDSTPPHISVFAPEGRLVRTIDGWGDAIAFDAAGNLYVGSLGVLIIKKMDTNGTVLETYNYQAKNNIWIMGMAVRPDGTLYIGEQYVPSPWDTVQMLGNTSISILYPNGTEQLVYEGNNRELTGSAGMAVDASGTIYAINTAYSFEIIAPDGTATTVGHRGPGNGEFNNITGISLGEDGYLYVSEFGNHRVQKLTTDGTFAAKWNGAGTDAFLYPMGTAADANGKVYVADPNNERIVWLAPGYTFGDNMSDNLKGQGTAWGYVCQGTNYTTRLQEAIHKSTPTPAPAPGFAYLMTITGIFLAGAVCCLRRAARKH
jgi:NHL repeat